MDLDQIEKNVEEIVKDLTTETSNRNSHSGSFRMEKIQEQLEITRQQRAKNKAVY